MLESANGVLAAAEKEEDYPDATDDDLLYPRLGAESGEKSKPATRKPAAASGGGGGGGGSTQVTANANAAQDVDDEDEDEEEEAPTRSAPMTSGNEESLFDMPKPASGGDDDDDEDPLGGDSRPPAVSHSDLFGDEVDL